MDNFARKLGVLPVVKDQFAKRPHLFFRFVISVLFLGLVNGATAARAYAENLPASSPGPGLTFAIADFDGDRRPDFASVQAGQARSGSSDYSIQIDLSESGRQSIDIVAPVGGLLIEARDVDGDRSIDLVVLATWRKQPVAIFLNDGHGTFSRAEVAAFPGAFSECQTKLAPAANPATDALGISPQPGAEHLPGRKRFIARPIGTEFDRCFDCRISSRPLPIVFCRTRPSFRSSLLLITLAFH